MGAGDAASDWICFLQSELQGWFTYHNVLGQLGVPGDHAAAAGALKPRIDWVMEAGRRVASGAAPFAEANDRVHAADELDALANALDRTALELEAALEDCERQDEDAMRLVVAIFAWRMYAYDNWIRSLHFFEQRFGDARRTDYLLQQTPHGARVVRLANTFFGWCRDPSIAPPDLAAQLVAESSHLPMLVVSRAQESRTIAAAIRGEG